MASTRNTSQRSHLLSLTWLFHFHSARVAANSPKHPLAKSDSAPVRAARRESLYIDLGERGACMREVPFWSQRPARKSAQAPEKKGPTGICMAPPLVKMIGR